MKMRLTAACLATLFSCGHAMAQTIPGQPVRRAANLVDETSQRVGNAAASVRQGVRNTAQAVDSRVGVLDNNQIGINNRVNAGVQSNWNGRTQPQYRAGYANYGNVVTGANVAAGSYGTTVYGANGSSISSYNSAASYSTPNYSTPMASSTVASSGYAQTMNQPVYPLQYDTMGREFICVSGQRVYFDNTMSSQPGSQDQLGQTQSVMGDTSSADDSTTAQNDQQESDQMNERRAGYGTYADPNATQNATQSDDDGAVLGEMNEDASERSDQLDAEANSQRRTDSNAFNDDRDDLRTDAGINAEIDTEGTNANLNGNLDANLNRSSGLNSTLQGNSSADANTGLNDVRSNATGNLNTEANSNLNNSGTNTRGGVIGNGGANTPADAASGALEGAGSATSRAGL